MKTIAVAVLTGLIVVTVVSNASAQLTAAKEGPIVYGHHHFNVTSVDEHRKFWTTLGGTAVKIGTNNDREIIRFPNVLVFMTARAPQGGTKGTSVNHVGFSVPNLRQAVDKVKAAGYPIVTRAELPESQPVKDDLAYIENQKTSVAFVMGPDDTKVELVENKAAAPSALHHIHFATQQVDEMKAWYVKVFGAKPGMRGSFQAADLPGVNLTYSPSPDAVAGTQGRSLDHIGFEVKNLEAFCKKLESMGIKLERPYSQVAALNISIAFIRDPWGTYIELTEGLDKVQ